MDSKDWCFFNLTAEDMEIVRSGPLQDSHILHFSEMIYKLGDFPLPQPPQMYLLADDIKPIPMSQDCIQFVFIPPPENDEGIGHWVCCYFNGKNIFVYDSANYGLCKEIKMFIGKFFPYIDMKTVKFPKVQQQKNNQDCGIFAVAFATSIIFGLKPETVQYESSEVLRDHLVSIFKKRKLEHFPHMGKLTKDVPTLALAIDRRRKAREKRIIYKAKKQILASGRITRNSNLTHEVGDSNKSSYIPPNCDKIDDIQTRSTEVNSTQEVLHTKLNDNKTNEEGRLDKIQPVVIDTDHVQILPDDIASCTPIITKEQKEKLLSSMEKIPKRKKWTKIVPLLNKVGPKRNSAEWKQIWFKIHVDAFDKYCKYKKNNTELEGNTSSLKNTNIHLSSYEKRVINYVVPERRPFGVVDMSDSSSDESKEEIVDADKKSKSSKKKKHQKENDVTITIRSDPIKRKMMKLVENHFETIEKSKQFSTKYYARKLHSSEKKLQELEKRTMAEEERYLKEMEYMNRKMDCLDSSVS